MWFSFFAGLWNNFVAQDWALLWFSFFAWLWNDLVAHDVEWFAFVPDLAVRKFKLIPHFASGVTFAKTLWQASLDPWVMAGGRELLVCTVYWCFLGHYSHLILDHDIVVLVGMSVVCFMWGCMAGMCPAAVTCSRGVEAWREVMCHDFVSVDRAMLHIVVILGTWLRCNHRVWRFILDRLRLHIPKIIENIRSFFYSFKATL